MPQDTVFENLWVDALSSASTKRWTCEMVVNTIESIEIDDVRAVWSALGTEFDDYLECSHRVLIQLYAAKRLGIEHIEDIQWVQSVLQQRALWRELKPFLTPAVSSHLLALWHSDIWHENEEWFAQCMAQHQGETLLQQVSLMPLTDTGFISNEYLISRFMPKLYQTMLAVWGHEDWTRDNILGVCSAQHFGVQPLPLPEFNQTGSFHSYGQL